MLMQSLTWLLLLGGWLRLAGGTTLFGGILETDRDTDDTAHACSICPPGYGVKRLCNVTFLLDTLCEECPSGLYSDRITQELACSVCRTCPDHYYEHNPCTPIQDAVCMHCSRGYVRGRGAAYGNEDYLRKCEGRTPPRIPPTHPKLTTRPNIVLPEPTTRYVWIPPTRRPTRRPTTPRPPIKKPPPLAWRPGGAEAGGQEEDVHEVPAVTEEPATISANDSGAQTGELKAASVSFQWPILVAGLIAAVVCFTIGALVAVCVVKSHKKQKRTYKVPVDLDDTDLDLMDDPYRNTNKRYPANEVAIEPDEISPIYIGNVYEHCSVCNDLHCACPNKPRRMFSSQAPRNLKPVEEEPLWHDAPLQQTQRSASSSAPPPTNASRKQFPSERPTNGNRAEMGKRKEPANQTKPPQGPGKAKKRHTFNRSNLRYIDEDSDDEVVIHVGRPETIYYHDSPAKRPNSWLANPFATLAEKFKRKSGNSSANVSVHRSSSMKSGRSMEANDTSVDTFTGHPVDTSSRRGGYEGTSV